MKIPASVIFALAIFFISSSASAWEARITTNDEGGKVCIADQSFNDGSTLLFSFQPYGFVIRLGNASWQLPIGVTYKNAIYIDGTYWGGGRFGTINTTTLTSKFAYSDDTAGHFIKAAMNGATMNISFNRYSFDTTLTGISSVFSQLVSCVESQTGGYNPFQ